MKQEFMLYIRNSRDVKLALTIMSRLLPLR